MAAFPGYGDQFQYHEIEDWVRSDQSGTFWLDIMEVPRFALAAEVMDERSSMGRRSSLEGTKAVVEGLVESFMIYRKSCVF